ncbi:MAG: TOBE domain-containing protein [Chelatococcus sp.]|nr:TOBE domain-containing protein [Chelatococcus sp.]
MLCPADEAELTGVVRTVEFLGSRCLMRADIGETLVTAFLPAEVTTQPGETVGLKASHPGRTRWFDVASGLAVGH